MGLSSVSGDVRARSPLAHGVFEDAQALLTGALVASLGIVLFKQAGLVSGGTVGLALLLHYGSGLGVGWCLIAANLPFLAFAFLRFGGAFTAKTLVALVLASCFTAWLPLGIVIRSVSEPLAAVMGGMLCGIAMLVLFRHRASLGGVNVLALWLQEKLGFSAGKSQMAFDALIVLGGGLWMGDASRIASSVLAVVTLNLVLAVNHRPGRYAP